MTIETQYNVNDLVFVLHCNKIVSANIAEVKVEATQDKTEIGYKIRGLKNVYLENEIYQTKEDLLNALADTLEDNQDQENI